jgi:hypothetical protein
VYRTQPKTASPDPCNNAVGHELGIIERAKEISPASVGLTIAEGKAQLDQSFYALDLTTIDLCLSGLQAMEMNLTGHY